MFQIIQPQIAVYFRKEAVHGLSPIIVYKKLLRNDCTKNKNIMYNKHNSLT